jgi:hypothetical protein
MLPWYHDNMLSYFFAQQHWLQYAFLALFLNYKCRTFQTRNAAIHVQRIIAGSWGRGANNLSRGNTRQCREAHLSTKSVLPSADMLDVTHKIMVHENIVTSS